MTTITEHTEHAVVIGGSSGMGLALAGLLLTQGVTTTVVGRNADRLAAAEHALKEHERASGVLHTHVADISREEDVRELFDTTGPIDHVVTTAADPTGAYQPITGFDLEAGRRIVDTKLFGAVLAAKYAAPLLRPGGSLTFVSGIAAYRPSPGGSIVAAANGALASLTAALAVELAPLRVNTLSPGWIDTPIWDGIAGAAKGERLGAMAARLPVGRIGAPEDVAQALRTLMCNPFITGTVLHVDGGHRLV